MYSGTQDKFNVIYGISVKYGKRGEIKAHHCFNRDYFVLPVKLPECALVAMTSNAVASYDGSTGHGRFSIEEKDGEKWRTHFVFNDATGPNWSKDSNRFCFGAHPINMLLAGKNTLFSFDREEWEEAQALIEKANEVLDRSSSHTRKPRVPKWVKG